MVGASSAKQSVESGAERHTSSSSGTGGGSVEGRQGAGWRTHLMSPRMAAAAAIEGHFVDFREWS